MVRLLFILLFASQVVSAQQKITLTVGNSYVPASYTGTIVNDNDYSAFPWGGTLQNGNQALLYKKTSNHADSGPLIFGLSTNGGQTYNFGQLNVAGYGLVQGSNLSLTVIQDTIFVSWEEPSEPTKMFFAYSVTQGSSWVFIGGIAYHTMPDAVADTGYYGAQFGKIIKMPSGKKLQPYYDAPVSAGNQHSGFIEISPDCSTLSVGNIISNQTGGAYPNGTHSELWVAITDTGATDATTKLVAVERNEQYEAFTHYRSADGGQTWERNTGLYLLNVLWDSPTDRYPVHILRGVDSFYLYVGVRKLGDYYIAYASVTPSDFYNNTGYSSLHRIQGLNADSNAATIDCGYPDPAIDYYGKKILRWYDTAPDYNGTDLPKHIIIYQKVLD
jgi:hypothetical protein